MRTLRSRKEVCKWLTTKQKRLKRKLPQRLNPQPLLLLLRVLLATVRTLTGRLPIDQWAIVLRAAKVAQVVDVLRTARVHKAELDFQLLVRISLAAPAVQR